MIKNKWVKLTLFGILGAIAGFSYYYFIGCTTNTCAITSNPYISTGYGLGAGLLLGWPGKAKPNTENK
ncbi:MAG: hypothetical protein AB7W47_16395 [Calditrichaceae bacterium]